MEKLCFTYSGNKSSTYLDENNNLIDCCCVTKKEYIDFRNNVKVKHI